MELPSSTTRGLTLVRARNGLSNMAVLASVLTLVERVSSRLNKDDATVMGSTMSKETINNITLKKIQQRLNITS